MDGVSIREINLRFVSVEALFRVLGIDEMGVVV